MASLGGAWFGPLAEYWSSQRSLHAPSKPEPVAQDFMWNTDPVSPICNAQSGVVQRQHPVCSQVALLLFTCGPLAVVRAIAAAVVDALNRVAVWSVTHVGNKQREVSPSLTDRYSSSAVTMVFGAMWVMASVKESCPNIKESVAGPTMRDEVVAPAASATSNVAAQQVATCHVRLIATVAATQPNDLAIASTLSRSNGNQISKCLPCNVDCARHKPLFYSRKEQRGW